MNYYKRHLGDYAKDTRHLTLAEHGAYCLLLDYYYSTESPIPDDRCERIANAYAEHEREAVRNVLQAFFTLTPEGWRNSRADKEISEFHAKSLKAKAAAESRWGGRNANAYADASPEHGNSHCERNASHKPLAIREKKEKKGAPDGAVSIPDVDPNVVADFLKIRKAKRAPLTDTALAGIQREAAKAGVTLEQALRTCCERGWSGFKADWVGAQAAATKAQLPGGGRREL
jgi:uncharacterized protein YdaU (DUF1376 family)